jgi:hypothetical protein
MALPIAGKRYLIVHCKSCERGFRVVDDPVQEGATVAVPGPKTLNCRGCGHVAEYEPREMRVARLSMKSDTGA